MIIKGEDSAKRMREFLETTKDIIIANNSVDSYYSNQKWNWYSDIKKQSQVMGKLLPFADLLKTLNVDIDSAIITLVSYYLNNNILSIVVALLITIYAVCINLKNVNFLYKAVKDKFAKR